MGSHSVGEAMGRQALSYQVQPFQGEFDIDNT